MQAVLALSRRGAALAGLLCLGAGAAAGGPTASVLRGRRSSSSLIPFGPKRKREMAAYSERHYGQHQWRLRDPKVIVEHMAQTSTAAAVYNTFAPDVPDVELGELPNVCSHFVISPSGRIFQLVNLRTRCRHTVGLNWTAIGIEHAGYGDSDVLDNPAELRASLWLTQYLRCRFGIPIARRDRPQREPQLALPPRAGAEPAQPDPRRLEAQLDAGLPRAAGADGPC